MTKLSGFISYLFVLFTITSCSVNSNVTLPETTEPTILPNITATHVLVELPDYLLWVVPYPGQLLTELEYKQLAPSLNWEARNPGICFYIAPFYFMEPGDFPNARSWLSNRVTLIVDDVQIHFTSILLTDLEGGYKTSQETGEKIFQEPAGSPLRPCYSLELEPGIHSAELSVSTTSGITTTFSWEFTITNK